MSILTALMTFMIVWWMVFFMALPFGIRTAEEANQEAQPGHAESAPVRPRLLLKAAITTVIAAGVFAVIWYVAEQDVFSFRNPA